MKKSEKVIVLAACSVMFGIILGWGCSGKVGFDNLNGTTNINIEMSSATVFSSTRNGVTKDAAGAASSQTDGTAGSTTDYVDVMCSFQVLSDHTPINNVEVIPDAGTCVNPNSCLKYSISMDAAQTNCVFTLSGTVPSSWVYTDDYVPVAIRFDGLVKTNIDPTHAVVVEQASRHNFAPLDISWPGDQAGFTGIFDNSDCDGDPDMAISSAAHASDMFGGDLLIKYLPLLNQDPSPLVSPPALAKYDGLGECGIRSTFTAHLPLAGLGSQGGQIDMSYGPLMVCVNLFDVDSSVALPVCDPTQVMSDPIGSVADGFLSLVGVHNLGDVLLTSADIYLTFSTPMNASSIENSVLIKNKDDPNAELLDLSVAHWKELLGSSDDLYIVSIKDFYKYADGNYIFEVKPSALTADNHFIGTVFEKKFSTSGAMSDDFINAASGTHWNGALQQPMVAPTITAITPGIIEYGTAGEGNLVYHYDGSAPQVVTLAKEVAYPEGPSDYSIYYFSIEIKGNSPVGFDYIEAPGQENSWTAGWVDDYNTGYIIGLKAMDIEGTVVPVCFAQTIEPHWMTGEPIVSSGGYAVCDDITGDIYFKLEYLPLESGGEKGKYMWSGGGGGPGAMIKALYSQDGQNWSSPDIPLSGFSNANLKSVTMDKDGGPQFMFISFANYGPSPASVTQDYIIEKGLPSPVLQWDQVAKDEPIICVNCIPAPK